jgi:hypothetical protein
MAFFEPMPLVHALHKHNLILFTDKVLRGKHDAEHHERCYKISL